MSGDESRPPIEIIDAHCRVPEQAAALSKIQAYVSARAAALVSGFYAEDHFFRFPILVKRQDVLPEALTVSVKRASLTETGGTAIVLLLMRIHDRYTRAYALLRIQGDHKEFITVAPGLAVAEQMPSDDEVRARLPEIEYRLSQRPAPEPSEIPPWWNR